MTTLLRVDASIRTEGSHSRTVGNRLEAAWRAAHPGGRVLARDLAASPLPHLNATTAFAFSAKGSPDAVLSDTLIEELRAATDLLVCAPLYNFGMPSTLKAWLDHVIRAGETFELREGRFSPLLQGGTAYVVAARGGVPNAPGQEDFLLPHLRTSLAFIGFTQLELVEIPCGNMPEGPTRLEAALARADALLRPAPAARAS